MKLEDMKKQLEELNKEPKKKFNQSIDLIVILKNLDLKKPDQQLDMYVDLHKSKGKKTRVCAIVGPELAEEAKQVCDKVIIDNELVNYKDKKQGKKLAREFDFFVGQANIMTKIAATFGRTLGPKGKMPNPKAGCVIPPKGSIKAVYDRLQKLIRVKVKDQLHFSISVGMEDTDTEVVADNILTILNAMTKALPQEKNNIKRVMIKKTMTKPMEIKW